MLAVTSGDKGYRAWAQGGDPPSPGAQGWKLQLD